MSFTVVSAAGKVIDLGADIAGRLNSIAAEPDLLDALAEALVQEQPELPPRLESLLADQEFRTLRTFLRRAAGTLSPDEHLRLLAGRVTEIPSDGIPWSWKSTRKRKLPPVGALTLSLKGDAKTSVRVLPGPRYEFKGADVVAGGGEAAADRFCDTVIDSIIESADARVNDWTNVLDGRIDDLIADALSRLPLRLEHRDKLTGIVNEKTGEALDRLNDELEQDLRDALTESTDSVRQALGSFADDNLAAFESLDEAAEHCMAPLKQLLSTCRTIEAQVASAVEKAEKQSLSIQYARTVSASDTSTTLLTFHLDPRNEHARALYRQMFGGDFTAAIDAGMNSDNAAISLEGGVFKRVLEREERSGLTFNLFGLGVESRRALSAELKIEQGPGGQINILTAEGAVSESRTGFGEGQSIEISNLVDLVTSADSPDAFTAKLIYTDKKLKPKELRQYLKSLEETGLLATGATERSAKLEATVGALRGPERAVRIETTLALTRAELVEATRADEDAIVRTAIEEQLKAYRRVGWAGAALRRLEALTGNAAIDVLVQWRDFSGRDVRRAMRLGRHASKTDKDIVSLVPAITIRARRLASFVSRWRELESVGATASNGVNELDDAALREIQKLHVAATADLKAWADASNLLIRLSRADVSPVAAVFLASLRRLCSKSDEHLVPVITWTEDGEERQIAVV